MRTGQLARISHSEMTPDATGQSDAASNPQGRADLALHMLRRFPSLAVPGTSRGLPYGMEFHHGRIGPQAREDCRLGRRGG